MVQVDITLAVDEDLLDVLGVNEDVLDVEGSGHEMGEVVPGVKNNNSHLGTDEAVFDMMVLLPFEINLVTLQISSEYTGAGRAACHKTI